MENAHVTLWPAKIRLLLAFRYHERAGHAVKLFKSLEPGAGDQSRAVLCDTEALDHLGFRFAVISLTLSEENRKTEQKYESLTVKMGYATVDEDDHGL
ncbi:MAG TPA: hypothetical protein VKC34_09330 [Blastocatellia bacterium]|nr:hypothetical protein [Blastocatellia bacterium]